MKHNPYYLKDFGGKMRMSLGRGGYAHVDSGVIICPFLPVLHNKTITHTSGRETRKDEHYSRWTIEGVDRIFETAKQIIETYNLVKVLPGEQLSIQNET